MNAIKALLLSLSLTVAAGVQSATQTCAVIGDSISSMVPDGKANQLALHLVSAERDVIFKNISSPGAALGVKDHKGYYNANTLATLNQINGGFIPFNCVIVQAGTNDFGLSVPWQDTVNSLRQILKWAEARKIKVLVLEPIWRANENVKNKRGLTLNAYRYVMAVTCAEFRYTCRWGSGANTVMGTSAGRANYSSVEAKAGIHLHPNPAGQRELANWIKAEAARYGMF